MYKYEKVVRNIIRDIDLEILRPESNLPTDEQLMKRYTVSRVTARKAVQELIDQGYVVKDSGKRLIGQQHNTQAKSLDYFQNLMPIVLTSEITNVITEIDVQQANPFSEKVFGRNVGAYFVANLWYQTANTIVANEQSLIPAEVVSQAGIDMYDKKTVQQLIETKVYRLGYNAAVTIDTLTPKSHDFKHVIQGNSQDVFYKLTENIYNKEQNVIIYNEYYLSTKNAYLKLHTR
ncbi:GntR family transcriptional regulator [Levilactobacillus acidifarinae]|uniref:HTH gntR-type domain-containing protein n=1 Tax=Levilactobacillus acidifarinae DSM 19394 = JCM 15949 TaxID=1423715 RepID=A0A0R1LSR1_9LACO|nr:winged helix-turn-helix domain-containing protein [Levilactobacillus acidifarinae]KRK95354.1 hypothetical protein FD25_GL001471 [Levilactobacillus acidifarinae DSM 19394]GEO70054.1 hypothetical protein LAC03_19640 [Levilactobacillus acidifarinae]